MPHVGIAMERSLQDGTLADGLKSLLARSMLSALGKRQSLSNSINNGVTDVKTALSSWDGCMSVTFCKWPVIGIIILGGIIVFSILYCCCRCLFCGLSCCCQCCYCLKCCGNCCGMCDPPGGRKHKYLDEPFVPPHHEQNQMYRSQAPMNYSAEPAFPPKREVPQYATFESDKKDADALPAMPSWNDGASQKVMLEEEVEMKPIQKQPTMPQSNMPPTGGMGAMGAARTISPRPAPGYSPPGAVSPYGPPAGAGGPNGYMSTPSDPYGQQQPQQQGVGYFGGQGYEQQQPNRMMNHQNSEYDVDQPYGSTAGAGAMGAAGAMAAGRPSQQPHGQDMNGYQDQPYGQQQGYPQSRTPGPYGDAPGYGRSVTPGSNMRSNTPGSYARSGTPGSQMRGGYGRPPPGGPNGPGGYGYDNPARMQSPGPQGGAGYRGSPGPQQDGYGRPPPHRQYTGDSHSQLSGVSSPPSYAGSRQQPQYGASQQSLASDYPAGSQTARVHEAPGSTHQIAELYSPTHMEMPKPAELHSEPTSPLQNNSGFDFNSGYSRNSPAPAEPTKTGAGYPGQRTYKPQGGY